MFFAYFGPETTLPLASVLAASLGFMMMMGRSSLRIASRIAKAVFPWFGAKSGREVKATSSQLADGMRSDRPHRGDIPSWVRPDRPAASTADLSIREDESSNG